MDLDDEELKATRKMNGSDKNVGSIEKDIKRCEQLIKVEHANWIGLSNQHAIGHLVEEYKELKEKYKQSKKYREKYIEVTNLYLNSIPKSKIKEIRKRYKQKIEKYYELKNQGKETDVEFYENITNIEIVRVLEELLEVKENVGRMDE